MATWINNLLSLLLLFFCLLRCAWADDPFLTDNPETLDPRDHYLVLYSYYNQFRFGKYLQAPALEYDFGVIRNLEIDTWTSVLNVFDAKNFPNFVLAGQRSRLPNATGLGDFNIELKYRFLQETKQLPQVAFAPNFFLPTGDYQRALGFGRFNWYPAFNAQKTIGKWLIYGMIAYQIIGTPDFNNYLFGGLVVQKQVTDKFALGVELFSQGRSGKYIASQTLLNIGTQYEVEKKCTLFFSLGHSVMGEKLLLGYFGIGWGKG